MYKFLLLLPSVALSFFNCSAITTLSPGDLAIIGFNFKDPDEFSFLAFKDMDAGTTLYFTDCGWQHDVQAFRKNEGLITYTVPSEGVDAMEVITYKEDHPHFSKSGVDGFFGLSMAGDQLLAFQGSLEHPQFIFAINNYESSWQENAIDNNSSALPPGLENGITAIAIPQTLNGYYSCTIQTGPPSIILHEITNPTNWIGTSERTELPGWCFKNPLPITFSNFELINLNGSYIASIQLESTSALIVCLEESYNGIDFTEKEKIKATTGTIVFFSTLTKAYYRIRFLDPVTNEIIYSESKTIPERNIPVYAVELYTLTGEKIFHWKKFTNDKKDIQVRSGIYLMKTISMQGQSFTKRIVINDAYHLIEIPESYLAEP